MASICNYSHPELQITEGLTRNGSGILFPYNPELYNLASGLYGPGAIYCWQLLLLSVIISWVFCEKDDNGRKRPAVSVDLLGAVAYPVFAATDALIHSIKILGLEHRGLAIFCLRYPFVELNGIARFDYQNHSVLDLHYIPPDVVNLGQHAIDLTGPLDVCYMFLAVYNVRLLLLFFDADLVEPTKWAERIASAAYGFVSLALFIIHCSLGDFSATFVLWFYEAITPFLRVFVLVICAVTFLAFVAIVVEIAQKVRAGQPGTLWKGLKMIGAWLLCCIFITAPSLLSFIVNGMKFVPDLGISVGERDQLATLIVGIATLLYTVYEASRRLVNHGRTGRDDLELQSLTQDND